MRQVEIPYTGELFKQKLLHWAAQQDFCVFLDSCNTEIDRYGQYDFLLGVSSADAAATFKNLDELQNAIAADPFAWRFGVLGYDLKNSLHESLKLDPPSGIHFPEMYFFQAEIVIAKKRNSPWLSFELGYSQEVFNAIAQTEIPKGKVEGFEAFTSNFTEAQYKTSVEQLRQHIKEGDSYEINLSQNFSSKAKVSHPAALWSKLTQLSATPFAGLSLIHL